MVENDTRSIALMSIAPRFAEKILAAEKKVEFRKKPFRRPVTHVIIYATAPRKELIGYFLVDGIVEASPRDLWKEYNCISGLDEFSFWSYFAGRDKGYAIKVGRVFRLPKPLPLAAIGNPTAPPQSFRYVCREAMNALGTLS